VHKNEPERTISSTKVKDFWKGYNLFPEPSLIRG